MRIQGFDDKFTVYKVHIFGQKMQYIYASASMKGVQNTGEASSH
jgi:hypothetical protein